MENATLRIFRAYASKKQALVLLAAFLPMLVLFAWNLPFNPDFPVAVRMFFAVLILFPTAFIIGPIRKLFSTGPILEISPAGILWHGWSAQIIPWTAIEKWGVKRYLGFSYITLHLKEPDAYRSTTFSGWLQRSNRWFGFGDVAINSGGMNRSFEQLAIAFSEIAPKSHLPTDPRLARLTAEARAQRNK